MASIGSKILSIIFPVECLGCELKGDYLCDNCLAKMPLRDNSQCFFCKKESVLGKTCVTCLDLKQVDYVLASVSYEDELVKNLIWQCKYNSVQDIAKSLAKVLNKYFQSRNITSLLQVSQATITYIPSSKKRLKTRGYNQAEIMARGFAQMTNQKFDSLLVKSKETESQQGASKELRLVQLDGVFEVIEGQKMPQTVILIDDVATTGSTLAEASKTLKNAGVARIIALVVAHEGVV